jgi:Uma2 family endonuclease
MVQVAEQIEILNDYETERGKPMPSLNHAVLQRNLLFSLIPFIEKYELLPEISIKIDDWGATPDIGIFEKQNIDFKHDVIKLDFVPLCAIEILSPTQSLSELIDKSEQFFLKGAKSYWLVLPQLENIYVFSQIFTYKIFQKNDILIDDNLGITIDLKKVFG